MLLLTLLLADAVLVAGAVGVSRRYERGRGRNRRLRLLAPMLWTALVLALTITYLLVSYAGVGSSVD